MPNMDLFTEEGYCPNCEGNTLFTLVEFERDAVLSRLDLECDICRYLFQIEVVQFGICELEVE